MNYEKLFKKILYAYLHFRRVFHKFIGVSSRYVLGNCLKKENRLACLCPFKNPRNVNCVSTHESNKDF